MGVNFYCLIRLYLFFFLRQALLQSQVLQGTGIAFHIRLSLQLVGAREVGLRLLPPPLFPLLASSIFG